MDNKLSPDEVLPELNCFFISASRHDRDRVELQLGFDGLLQTEERRFTYDIDFLLFVPKTLGLREIEESSQLRNEFQSYVRLHTHTSNPDSNTSVLRVRDRLQQLCANPSLANIRIFAIEFDGFIRAQRKRLKKDFSLLETDHADPTSIGAGLADLHHLMSQMRELLRTQGLEGKRADACQPHSVERNLLLLNEHISHDYVHLLVELHFAAVAAPNAKELLDRLDELSADEARRRKIYGLTLEDRRAPNATNAIDIYPRRMSLFKKYFQKTLFVDVTSEAIQDRLLIPVYGISAAFAAAFAIMVQLYQARTMAERVGINSIALITVGIVAYVAKDILKNFMRMYIMKGGGRFFADYKKTLWINRDGQRHKLGSIREYVRLFDSERLPESLARARYSVPDGDLEQFLHEDVLQFRKKVSLNLKQLENNKEFPWGLREIVRFRFDRLLTSMEDAFKTLHLLGANGSPSVRQGHRVYYVYLASWIRRFDPAAGRATRPSFKSFRISLDKSGVLGCEPHEWSYGDTVPPPPT